MCGWAGGGQGSGPDGGGGPRWAAGDPRAARSLHESAEGGQRACSWWLLTKDHSSCEDKERKSLALDQGGSRGMRSRENAGGPTGCLFLCFSHLPFLLSLTPRMEDMFQAPLQLDMQVTTF